MVIRLQGGLGNQMFQYAYGISRDRNLKVDVGLLASGNPPRSLDLASFVDLQIVEDPTGLTDYWQSEKYFDTTLIRNLYRKPKGQPGKEILNLAGKIFGAPESCFVGVRRADYLWPERLAYHGVMPIGYYREAMAMMPEGTKFFCFSDDPEWASENLHLPSVRTEPAWDIWLMSLCKHAIIANSTFHWWGAWLGADRKGKVIAPKNWFANGQPWNIVPDRWITI